jgi:hypothetical protein
MPERQMPCREVVVLGAAASIRGTLSSLPKWGQEPVARSGRRRLLGFSGRRRLHLSVRERSPLSHLTDLRPLKVFRNLVRRDESRRVLPSSDGPWACSAPLPQIGCGWGGDDPWITTSAVWSCWRGESDHALKLLMVGKIRGDWGFCGDSWRMKRWLAVSAGADSCLCDRARRLGSWRDLLLGAEGRSSSSCSTRAVFQTGSFQFLNDFLQHPSDL